MENHASFSELRGLLKIARQLRKAATETGDSKYKILFLHTAASLEAHAKKRAFGSTFILMPRGGHYVPERLAG
jgi:hypothetical protein